jgi:hypothetical protein
MKTRTAVLIGAAIEAVILALFVYLMLTRGR